MDEIYKRIKNLREIRNYTQEHIADSLNLSQRQYSSIENGQTQLTVDRLFEIAKVLEVNVGDILGTDNQFVYYNNFNNNATQNKGNLVFNQDNFEEQRQLYERIVRDKDTEIEFLKSLIKKS